MTTETIQVKRTAVQASDSLVGKTVLLPDGTKSKITGVPSGTSYSVDGQRARISAYLVVKDGRAFKVLTQPEVEGTVISVKDSGGYATYKFAPPAKKPARQPRTPKQPKEEPVKPARQPRQPRTPKEEPVKPARAQRQPKVTPKAEPEVSPAVQAIAESGLPLTEKAVIQLRKEVTQLIASYIHAGLPEGVQVTSESKYSENRFLLTVGIDFSCMAEEQEDEVSVDDALEVLIENNLVTAREARRMSDEDIMSMYEMYLEENGEKSGDDFDDDFDSPKGEDEQEEGEDEQEEGEGEEATQEEIKLPDAAFKGFDSLKGKARAEIEQHMLDATGLTECVAGSLFALTDKEGEDDGTVAFVNFVLNSKQQPVALLLRVEEFEETGAIKRVALAASQFGRLAPIFGQIEEEEGNELENDGFDDDDNDELDNDLDLDNL